VVTGVKREFVITATFDRLWAKMDLGDAELRGLENMLLINPSAGVVIPHLSGARKIRFPLAAHGKSGGARAIYVDIAVKSRTYFLLAYPKSVQDNLTPEQAQDIRRLVEQLKGE
jgi:hypothetical protein